MIPTKQSVISFDREVYDAPVMFTTHVSSMGAVGQPYLYTNFPTHSSILIERPDDVPVSCDEFSNQEKHVQKTVSSKSQKPVEGAHSNQYTSLERKIDDTRMNAVLRGRNDIPASYSFPPTRPYVSIQPYSTSQGGHDEYGLDRSSLSLSSIPAIFTSNSWHGTNTGIINLRREGSYDRFRNGAVENSHHVEEDQGKQIKQYLHSGISQTTLPVTSHLGTPAIQFVHHPCEGIYPQGFFVSTSEDQSHYFNRFQHGLKNAQDLMNNASMDSESRDITKDPRDYNHIIRTSSRDEHIVNERKEPFPSVKVAEMKDITDLPNISSNRKDESTDWGCTCKRSKCLKLYCQCFGSGNMCRAICRCVACMNTAENQQHREEATKAVLSRNPNAFDKKCASVIETGADNASSSNKKQVFACKCRKSACLKKYCECFNAKSKCNSTCRCLDCRNMPSDGNNPTMDEKVAVKPSPGPADGNERMMDAVQNLTMLKANSPSRPNVSSRSSPSLPSVITMSSAVSSGDDDDSATGMNHNSLYLSASLQGMDVLALAAMSELKNRVTDSHVLEASSRSNMLRISITSTSSISLDDGPSYDYEKRSKKRPFGHITDLSDIDHSDLCPDLKVDKPLYVEEKLITSLSEFDNSSKLKITGQEIPLGTSTY